jgi:predicted nicotinamide N-methyase
MADQDGPDGVRPTAATADDFVRCHTRPGPVPLVPEVRLRQAADVFALWERVGTELCRPAPDLPFWAFPWAGGQGVARYVLDHPGLVAGRRVLDVGTGSGLVAIAAALAGARTVTATDVDPFALAAARRNAQLNGVTVTVRAADLLSGAAEAEGAVGEADVVLAGDLFYERRLAERVVPFLDRGRAAGAHVLAGDPDRPYLPRDRFVLLARYRVPVAAGLEATGTKLTAVWCLTPLPVTGAQCPCSPPAATCTNTAGTSVAEATRST